MLDVIAPKRDSPLCTSNQHLVEFNLFWGQKIGFINLRMILGDHRGSIVFEGNVEKVFYLVDNIFEVCFGRETEIAKCAVKADVSSIAEFWDINGFEFVVVFVFEDSKHSLGVSGRNNDVIYKHSYVVIGIVDSAFSDLQIFVSFGGDKSHC